MTAAVIVVAAVLVLIVLPAWLHNRPFDYEYADIPLTIDLKHRKIRLHKQPSPEQLVAIEEWARLNWSGLRKLRWQPRRLV